MLNRKLHIIVTAVVLLSSCAWLPFALIKSDVNVWLRVSAALIGILAFVLLFERDMYLPFLADTAFPTALLVPSSNTTSTFNKGKGDVVINIGNIPKNAKVVYWAAESGDPRRIQSKGWKEAYGDYSNSGIVQANEAGIATITLRCPQSYTVTHFGVHDSELPPHLHYRYELSGTKGMLSQVYTFPVVCSGTNETV